MDGRGDDRHGFSRLVSIVLLNLRGFIYRDRYHKLECLDVDFLFFKQLIAHYRKEDPTLVRQACPLRTAIALEIMIISHYCKDRCVDMI